MDVPQLGDEVDDVILGRDLQHSEVRERGPLQVRKQDIVHVWGEGGGATAKKLCLVQLFNAFMKSLQAVVVT